MRKRLLALLLTIVLCMTTQVFGETFTSEVKEIKLTYPTAEGNKTINALMCGEEEYIPLKIFRELDIKETNFKLDYQGTGIEATATLLVTTLGHRDTLTFTTKDIRDNKWDIHFIEEESDGVVTRDETQTVETLNKDDYLYVPVYIISHYVDGLYFGGDSEGNITVMSVYSAEEPEVQIVEPEEPTIDTEELKAQLGLEGIEDMEDFKKLESKDILNVISKLSAQLEDEESFINTQVIDEESREDFEKYKPQVEAILKEVTERFTEDTNKVELVSYTVKKFVDMGLDAALEYIDTCTDEEFKTATNVLMFVQSGVSIPTGDSPFLISGSKSPVVISTREEAKDFINKLRDTELSESRIMFYVHAMYNEQTE